MTIGAQSVAPHIRALAYDYCGVACERPKDYKASMETSDGHTTYSEFLRRLYV